MNNRLAANSSLANEGPPRQLQTFSSVMFIFAATFALYFLSRSPGLDEFDSVNFAMGVRSFNLWDNQPHPPGYPLFIFAGWVFGKIFRLDPEISLHLVSALGGALFIAAWFLIIRTQFSQRLAWWIAACLTITPIVWMTATKVLSDTLAAGFLSAEIFAAICLAQKRSLGALFSASLFAAAAAGARPQLILVTIVILVTGLKQTRADWKMSILGAAIFVAGCLAWLLPMWYLQARLRPDLPAWQVYPSLAYSQWKWRLHRPHTFIGAGDWGLRYLGTRFAEHILGWLGVGFGFIRSPFAFIAGVTLSLLGFGTYLFSHRDAEDAQFWKFHASWSLLHVTLIFICLDGTQRYYLPIYPLLLVALLRGFLRLRPWWNWMGLAVPALFLYITIPLAIENHRDEAPPLRLVRYLEKLYPSSQRSNVALLFIHAVRHSEWYAPEFETFRKLPSTQDMPRILANKSAVYTDDATVPLPPEWRRVPVAIFERSVIIHVKHHTVTLFLIVRH
jgi:hypothetical protein